MLVIHWSISPSAYHMYKVTRSARRRGSTTTIMLHGGEIQFDHAVLLLPYRAVMTLPEWITDNFIVSSRDYHTDGKTVHRLIVFKDGCYLELLAFIRDDPVRAAGHGWDQDFGVVRERARLPVAFYAPRISAFRRIIL